MRRKARRNITLLLQSLDQSRPEPVTLIEIGDSFTILEEWDSARQWYERLLGQPGCETSVPVLASQAHMGLGNILNRQEDYAAAIGHFEHARRLCPARVDALYSLAVSQELGGDVPAAIGSLQRIFTIPSRALQVGVDYRQTLIKANLRLGRIFWESERYPELEALVAAALRDHAGRAEIQNMAGTAYWHTGKLIEALHCFERSLKITIEGNLDAYVGLCLVYQKAGRRGHVETTLKQIAQLFSHLPRYWAFVRLVDMAVATIPAEIPAESIAQEAVFLRRTFGPSAFPPVPA
jgi:tetratricopeptide (TPR) repeat protein